MIFRLLALILLPLAAYYIVRSLSQRFSFNGRQTKMLFVVVVFVLVIAVLVVIGRLPAQFILAPLGVAATFMLRMAPTLFRLLPMWQMFKSRTSFGANRQQGKTSTIRTQFLDVELDHDTGNMDGTVLKGQYAQRKLSSLQLPDLLLLLQECEVDTDSSQVLQAYLDRNHAAWREQGDYSKQQSGLADESIMTTSLALEILGLPESATEKEVIKAHRQLMQKMHPDRGGSDYLAKKINAAKDYLLKHL